MVIYKITNLITNKVYIGQTNDFNHRMIAHKSNSNNKKSHSYNLPLCCAIRKYGWGNFTQEIIEESPEGLSKEEQQIWANEKEIEYIIKYSSLVGQNGYNLSPGGGQAVKDNFTFEECVGMSNLFMLAEVIDIQSMLKQGKDKQEILDKYSPKLTLSFLDNINQGLNFRNPSLKYPIFDYLHSGVSHFFTKEEQNQIKQEIINGDQYSDISKKWGISNGMLACINNGSVWNNNNYTYPLSVRGNSRLHNWNTWVQPMIYDLEHSELSLKEISKKYEKAYSTVKKINEGFSYHDNNKKYPLTKNRSFKK